MVYNFNFDSYLVINYNVNLNAAEEFKHYLVIFKTKVPLLKVATRFKRDVLLPKSGMLGATVSVAKCILRSTFGLENF